MGEFMDPKLQFQSIALDKSLYWQTRIHEININEGQHHVEGIENIKFPTSGGGVSICIQNLTRNLFWRTYDNVLELSEYCLDVDLVSNSIKIVFNNSVVLPDVYILNTKECAVIFCCTVHAAHFIPIDLKRFSVPKILALDRAIPSILKSVINFNFENEINNYHYGESIAAHGTHFAAEAIWPNKQSGTGALFSVCTNMGNIVLIRMPGTGSPSHTILNQSSRISRIWSGINPWAGGAQTEAAADLAIVNLTNRNQMCLLAICKDNKIRSWSCQSQSAYQPVDLSPYLKNVDPTEQDIGFEYKIKACQDINRFVVYVSRPHEAAFIQFQINRDPNSDVPEFSYLSTVLLSTEINGSVCRHFVDFTYSSKHIIRALWKDSDDQAEVFVCDADVGLWHAIAMQQLSSSEITLDDDEDIHESYMNFIFTPGRFSLLAIYKALSIPNRTFTGGIDYVRDLNWTRLKQKVSDHINAIVRDSLPEIPTDDVSEEEEFAVQQELVWNEFYQSCLQYQQSLSIPLGLTIPCMFDKPKAESFVFMVQKSHLSVLTPVSSLEAVCRKSDPKIFKGIVPQEACHDGNLSDVVKLLNCLGVLAEILGPESTELLQQNINEHKGPSLQLEDMDQSLIEIITVDSEEKTELQRILAEISDIPSAFEILISCLEPTIFNLEILGADGLLHLSGSCGIELITQSIVQHTENRLQLVTLLYSLAVLLNTSEKKFIQSMEPSNLQSQVMTYVRVYLALKWLSTTQIDQTPSTSLESTLQTLSMHESSTSITQSRYAHLQARSTSILEFFVSSEGSRLLHMFFKSRHFAQSDITAPEYLQYRVHTMEVTPTILPATVNFILYLIWPQELSVNFFDAFGHGLAMHDFMLCAGQHRQLQVYLEDKLQPWCLWCPSSREYMLAHCYLYSKQYDKALESFMSASSKVGQEEYLARKLLREEDLAASSNNELEMVYYTKVVPIFKKFGLSEYVINLAEHAIKYADPSDPNLPSLWSSVFHENVELGEYEKAYKAIIYNPNIDYQKDCLRAFVVALCENKKYETLVQFPFDDMQDELVNILEQRARCTDLATTTHQYYDILFSFHIHRGNFRKAASIMYEQGWRLGCEFSQCSGFASSLNILRKEHTCFLACINCLFLVAEDNRWIIHPGTSPREWQDPGYTSPKHTYEGEEINQKKQKIVIKELNDIQKECLLIEYRIKIQIYSQNNKGNDQLTSGPSMTAPEVVSLLCHLGLYDDAILISQRYNLSLCPVFESLTARCVKLSYMNTEDKNNAWSWLRENSLLEEQISSGNPTQWTVVDAAYRLLQIYLEKYGNKKLRGTSYYRSVAMGLLGLSSKLPAWFVNTYKMRNCPELLRLLVYFDRLEEATYLTLDFVDAAMGIDSHKFGIQHPINSTVSTGRPTWLPHTIIDQLHYILDSQRTQKHYDDLYHLVHQKMNEYFSMCERVSQEMIQTSKENNIVVLRA